MKQVQPKYAKEVIFVAVDIGYEGDLKELDAFAKQNDYPWLVGLANRTTLETFNVKIQSTKIAINKGGLIVYRAGYGKGSKEEWISVFKNLVGGQLSE